MSEKEWRGTQRFPSQLEMRPYLSLKQSTRNSEVPPHHAKGDLTSLRRHVRVPHVDTQLERNPKLPPQLHTTHEILHCMLEETFLGCSISKESPCYLLELERVLDTLYKTPEVSPDTRPHLRGMLSFPPQVRKSPIFPSSS